ncbi:hypothetical protein BDV95DRAFT_618914 [Massariosphaeria phaeospora]|uniref:Uncharacterized protein n=1 Tax=Massariosphaeria phaeospora TaxID=100035 RepID=A0A7C8I5S3_9PLEO|nr:hypothetical protein BDV95DRAFT_618914 [Massariosphaeria phaeospora]
MAPRKTTAKQPAAPNQLTAPKRRLRSGKEPASPLQVLKSPERKKKKTAKKEEYPTAEEPARTPATEQVEEPAGAPVTKKAENLTPKKEEQVYKQKIAALEDEVATRDELIAALRKEAASWRVEAEMLQTELDDARARPSAGKARKRTKKRTKSSHTADVSEVPSLNETVFDTDGHSSSLLDIHPRPSHIPSPMFDDPTNIFSDPDEAPRPTRSRTSFEYEMRRKGHVPGSGSWCVPDIFSSDEEESGDDVEETPVATSRKRDRASFERELRRNGHVPGSGSWCVPEHSSDEDDSDGDENDDPDDASLWTQQPPPAPIPAHASLPPSSAASPPAETAQTPEEVRRQRAKLMKHTPAKPSRLRKAYVPTPTTLSDVGDSFFVPRPNIPIGLSSNFYTRLTAAVDENRAGGDAFDDMPDAEPLDIGLPQEFLDEAARHAIATCTYPEWDDVMFEYSDDEEL